MKHNRKCTEVTYQLKSISLKYNFFSQNECRDFTTSNISEYSQDTTEHIHIQPLLKGKRHSMGEETECRQAVEVQGILVL